MKNCIGLKGLLPENTRIFLVEVFRTEISRTQLTPSAHYKYRCEELQEIRHDKGKMGICSCIDWGNLITFTENGVRDTLHVKSALHFPGNLGKKLFPRKRTNGVRRLFTVIPSYFGIRPVIAG